MSSSYYSREYTGGEAILALVNAWIGWKVKKIDGNNKIDSYTRLSGRGWGGAELISSSSGCYAKVAPKLFFTDLQMHWYSPAGDFYLTRHR